jgi:hypothetical protein
VSYPPINIPGLTLPDVPSVATNSAGPMLPEAEVARLREDGELLDFIESHPEIGLGSSHPHTRIVGFSPTPQNNWTWKEWRANTYREALRKARAALAGEAKP